MKPTFAIGLFLCLTFSGPCHAQIANGWRGNGTGLYPDATAPLNWSRTPQGLSAVIRIRANRPDPGNTDGIALAKGLVRDWLVLGPYPVKHSVSDFNKAQLADEATVQPSVGDKAGELVWKTMTAKLDDRWAFGPANPPWANVAEALGTSKPNQIAYAHTYLYSPRGGTVLAIVDHMYGMRAWLNGKEVYSAAERKVGLGTYYALSRVDFGTDLVGRSPRIELNLQPGWNRLLLKISSYIKEDSVWRQQHFLLRVCDVPPVTHVNKNIVWMTELPQRSNATPIVVGRRVFVMAEPDELICLAKETGKVLWKAANSYYEMLTPAERQANPAFADRVEPLLVELRTENDFIKRLGLRTRLQTALTKIDSARFAWQADGHFQAHFGIVGFTTPTPVSDGKHVWVWCGNAVAACYDLEGKRRWITRVPVAELSYPSSPALADGTLAVFLGKLYGLDAATGQVRWEQKKADLNMGAVLAANFAGVPVFVTSMGHVIRARDGKLLYREAERAGGASSWTAPVILGNVVYLPRYGIKQLLVLDFTGVEGDDWVPKRLTIPTPDGLGRNPQGNLVDRSTAGSPLVVDDLVYMVDIYSTLYVFDLKARKMLYHHDTELHGLFHYNAVPVAASPALIGKHIVIQDNQGVALVLEPGRTFKQVGKNHIATQIDRWWPVPGQETVGYAPPVPDGRRLFIRGERYLYCIGE